MKSENVIKDKSLDFGIRITKMVRIVLKRMVQAEHSICSQILKSGTSIGANVREGEFAESREDFKHKLKIALKEANETDYWLTILHKGEYIDERNIIVSITIARNSSHCLFPLSRRATNSDSHF